nr:transposase [Flagellimonas sp. CMM7]
MDPVVFFKLLITGYLENITSDRKLLEHCSMRMDVLYFLGYDLDEELPWHSTVSRTRQLYPESLFEKLFNKVFALCVESGMVSGHTQAVDSAPIKANASMESVVPKMPATPMDDHLKKVSEENGEATKKDGKTVSPAHHRTRTRAEAHGKAPPKPSGKSGTPLWRITQESTTAQQQDTLQPP